MEELKSRFHAAELAMKSLYGPATNKLVGEVDDDRISQTSKAFGA